MGFINTSTLAALAENRPICKAGTMEPAECIVSSTDIPSILFHTNSSAYDIGITFTFATADRLEYVDASIPLVETYYTAVVDARFAPDPSSLLANSVIRPIVLYMVGVISLFVSGSTLVIFLSETRAVRRSSELLQIKSHSARLRLSLVCSVETVFTMGSPMELRSPVSTAAVAGLSYTMIFVLAIFMALITSQLTTAQSGALPPPLASLAGARIAIQGNLLQPLLVNTVRAVPVVYATLDGAVASFYNGNRDRLDGFATQTEIVNYYQAAYL